MIARTIPAVSLFAALATTARADCIFNSTSDVAFGVYDVFSSLDTDSTGSVRIRCNPIVPYTVKLSAGTAGSFMPRRLANGTAQLEYNLYLDSAHTQVWGDGSSGTSFLSAAAHNGNRTYTIYGRIPNGQDPTVGSYVDAIIATLDF